MATESVQVPVPGPGLVRRVARAAGVVALLLAVVDLCRWGNRAYVAGRFLDLDAGDPDAVLLLRSAQDALATGLLRLAVAVVAVAIGWRLRVVARR